jgi:hypothetical protein
LPPPPIKSTIRLTKAKVKAELQAKASWKKTKSGWDSSLRDHLESMIDKIDPLELISAFGLTFLVYKVIKSSEVLLAKAAFTDLDLGASFKIQPFAWFDDLIIAALGTVTLTAEQEQALTDMQNTTDWLLFVESFGIAFFLLRNGASILNSAQGITGAIAGFFGIGVVAA